MKRERARERVERVERARNKDQERQRPANTRELRRREIENHNDFKDVLLSLIAKIDWAMEKRWAITLATMLAWSGALLCWFLMDCARSFSHVLVLMREGWSWSRAMGTFQPPIMLRYIGLRLVDIPAMTEEEYDDFLGILKQICIGSFICMCLCPLYLKVGVRSFARLESVFRSC